MQLAVGLVKQQFWSSKPCRPKNQKPRPTHAAAPTSAARTTPTSESTEKAGALTIFIPRCATLIIRRSLQRRAIGEGGLVNAFQRGFKPRDPFSARLIAQSYRIASGLSGFLPLPSSKTSNASHCSLFTVPPPFCGILPRRRFTHAQTTCGPRPELPLLWCPAQTQAGGDD